MTVSFNPSSDGSGGRGLEPGVIWNDPGVLVKRERLPVDDLEELLVDVNGMRILWNSQTSVSPV